MTQEQWGLVGMDLYTPPYVFPLEGFYEIQKIKKFLVCTQSPRFVSNIYISSKTRLYYSRIRSFQISYLTFTSLFIFFGNYYQRPRFQAISSLLNQNSFQIFDGRFNLMRTAHDVQHVTHSKSIYFHQPGQCALIVPWGCI